MLVWSTINLPWALLSSLSSDPLLWMLACFKSLDETDFRKLLVGCWAIWTKRNETRHNLISPDVMEAAYFITSYLASCATALDCDRPPPPHPPDATARWEPPAMGSLKINVDSGKIGNHTTWAGLIRDGRGRCIGWYSKSISPILDPEHGEYLATKWGLIFARFLGISTITLEADCLALVSAITDDTMLNGTLQNLLTDIRVLLQEFDSCQVIFIRRNANKAAHLLAKSSTTVGFGFDDSTLPSSVREQMYIDYH
ncbi:hypothetical protein M569_11402 [Genlisea aurea]|uniref:RNase H type-1 domain-containing protein n=1 Tax=Genlisea aurea TaxID=192259 RepID=S8C916_9LAMI|nr:hypothetical protein M569_11402 [Genlisea aurea]